MKKLLFTLSLLLLPLVSHAALGDILYGTANPSINTRLPIGASSTVLTTNGSIPAWETISPSSSFGTTSISALSPLSWDTSLAQMSFTPAGNDRDIQFNSAGFLSGSDNLTYDGTNLNLSSGNLEINGSDTIDNSGSIYLNGGDFIANGQNIITPDGSLHYPDGSQVTYSLGLLYDANGATLTDNIGNLYTYGGIVDASSTLGTNGQILESIAGAGAEGGEGVLWKTFTDPNWSFTNGYLTPTTTIGIILNASSSITNLTTISSTSTYATSTNLYTSGQTILAGAGGNVGIGTTSPYDMLSVAGEVVGKDFVATSTTAVSRFQQTLNLGSTTLQNFTGVNATTTYATSTNSFASTASSTNLFSSLLTVEGNGLVVTSAGNVAIGTTTPTAALDISEAQGTTPFLRIDANNINNNGQPSIIDFYDSKGKNQNSLIENITESQDGAALLFATHPDNSTISSTGAVERMRILGNGNVGIGTSSPLELLTLFGSGTTAAASPQILIAASSTSAGAAHLATPNWVIGTNLADGGAFEIASSTVLGTSNRFQINGYGQFSFNNGVSAINDAIEVGSQSFPTALGSEERFDYGVGAAPATVGDFGGTSTFCNNIQMRNVGGTGMVLIYNGWGSCFYMVNGGLTYYNGTSSAGNLISSNRFTVTNSGQFGIATSSPSAQLAVTGSSTDATLAFLVANSNNKTLFSVQNNGIVSIGTSTPSSNEALQITESSTTTSPEILIGTPNSIGGEIIMVDATAGHSTCTELFTVGGALLTKVITCPTQ